MRRRNSNDVIRRELRVSSGHATRVRPLPLVHTTSVAVARNALPVGTLRASKCSVFEKELAYFFVGRPSYRLKGSDQRSRYITPFPVVFVLAGDAIQSPFHVYPFDTGAAANGIFDTSADTTIPLEDYELDPSIQAAYEHIERCFRTTGDYFDAILNAQYVNSVGALDYTDNSYIGIAGSGVASRGSPDMRASAVEVAVQAHVRLHDVLKLFIAPKQMMGGYGNAPAAEVGLAMNLGAEVQYYDWQPNTVPDDYYEELHDMVREYLTSSGSL